MVLKSVLLDEVFIALSAQIYKNVPADPGDVAQAKHNNHKMDWFKEPGYQENPIYLGKIPVLIWSKFRLRFNDLVDSPILQIFYLNHSLFHVEQLEASVQPQKSNEV